ncbi:hypothetical protein QTP70_029712 [Hemibagrus guttatus]|uniref:Gypsy retrotransposon integrase-like protein 1 n=1 Tax=Hemibagrus guttatus TaxID=175788 RepID=A0AAE0QTW7_9TELE|nr:hypothetical protein QTP70_029712 [Hemibagrus guttatus]
MAVVVNPGLDRSDSAFNPGNMIDKAVCNVICSIIFGQRFESDDPQLNHMLKAVDDYFKVLNSPLGQKTGPYSMDASTSQSDPLQDLVAALCQALTVHPAPAPAPPSTTSVNTITNPSTLLCASPMVKPAPYSGSAEDCNGFLLQCSLVLEMQPHMYPTERSKVVFVITQLSSKAVLWAESLWSQNHPAAQSYSSFVDHFKEVFGKPSWDSSIGEELYNLKQGKMSVNEYALQFRTLATKSGWNEQALLTSYRQGLDPQVRLHLPAYEDSIGLERFIQLSIRVATRMQSCLEEHQGQASLTTTLSQPDSISPPEPAPEPMHLGSSHLTPAERQRRLAQNLCLYCGSPGHAISACPIRPPRPMVSTIFPSIPKMKPLTTIGTLTAAHVSITVVALLYSGSAGNFISGTLCRQLRLRTTATSTAYQIQSITGRPGSRRQATSIESPLENRSVDILACYAPFSDVFCPKRDSKLPPHQPWDCAIDLLPGEPVPRGKIYPLSIPEEKAMEEYIEEALAQGYIHPSTSPASSSYPLPLVPVALEHLRGATVFTKLDLRSAYNLIRIREGDKWKTAFVMPTDHYEYLVMPYGLINAPSIFQDFIHEVLREFLHRFVLVYINDILIYSWNLAKHRHHVAEVLKRLREFQLFLKAEKCSFHQPSVQFLGYNIDSSGIRMDEEKVAAIRDWPTPTTVKELQRFLGFANFYRPSTDNPLTSLLRNKPKSLCWTSSAEEAFTTASLLVHPDPDRPFIVEVDASTTGVGAVLFQQQGNPSRLHPCAFSHKLNPAENTFEPPRDSTHDKHAGPFTRFDFTISYRPGSKNTKADALSRLYTLEENPEVPKTILPERVIVSPITWSKETLPPTNASTNTPSGCPPVLQYITRARRTPLIHSAHTSLGTGHPGANETLSLLKDHFWWPNMASDVRRYVQGCRDCAMSKSPRHLPSSKLLPLPVPNRPWSHLGVDFITDLPVSKYYTCIFVVVDRFSKSCCLIPLKGLPTAMETAELMFNHIFRYFGIPEDIVWPSACRRDTNGQTERKIQEIGRYLRTFCHGHQDSWSQYQGWAEYAQNSLRQPSTGLTPFQCILGYQPPLFPWSGEPLNVPVVDYWFQESERVWDSAHHQLQRALRRHRRTVDLRRSEAPIYQSGQKVWLSTRDIHLCQPCHKLGPRFIGPFTILKQINPITYKLQLPPEYRIHPTFHESLLKPHHPSVSPSTEPGSDAAEPPPPTPTGRRSCLRGERFWTPGTMVVNSSTW